MPSLSQFPAPGIRLVRWVGDIVTFTLHHVPAGSVAKLRTQLGRAAAQRAEILAAAHEGRAEGLTPWQDLPMTNRGSGIWEIAVPVLEVGFFPAKAYATDERGWQHWPDGPDCGINVQPAWTRSGNAIYCAFPRQFGPNRSRRSTSDPTLDDTLKALEAQGYATLPPSGKLRDVTRALDHICGQLGFRHLLLLPINPTPTTFARFGRFGSPYAALDLTGIDPALVEFDQRTTGTQQFEELAHALHGRGGRLFLDMVINHTGWGSTLWERHPEWFQRQSDGRFLRPGAWGTVWEDLVELDPEHRELWGELAEAFLVWCRRGVDGFRCDAGYKVPVPVWRYITARVRQEYPDTVFLLEGLGGAWEATEALLTVGGMQWAYSELFQNYDLHTIPWYLDQAWAISTRSGPLVHFCETHDNVRLPSQPQAQIDGTTGFTLEDEPVPERARRWALQRTQLSALTSVAGGYAITNGVEWLATEKVNVHSARGLAWGSPDHLIAEIATLNRLLQRHPAFRGDAQLTRLSPDATPVYALRRTAAEGSGSLLILVNTDLDRAQAAQFEAAVWHELGEPNIDLLASDAPRIPIRIMPSGFVEIVVAPGAVVCLSPTQSLERPPSNPTFTPFTSILPTGYQAEIEWSVTDAARILLLPPNHSLVIRDTRPFRVEIKGLPFLIHAESQPNTTGFEARLSIELDRKAGTDLQLTLIPLLDGIEKIRGTVRLLAAAPSLEQAPDLTSARVLLTNGRGGMAHVHAHLSAITSKYDCLLAANLHPEVPSDRHVLVKRVRAWVNANGFTSALDNTYLSNCDPTEKVWVWNVPAGGDSRSIVKLHLQFQPHTNRLEATFQRCAVDRNALPELLTDQAPVRLILRFDLEDRNYHGETKWSEAVDQHFTTNTRPLGSRGFEFVPATQRHLRVTSSGGQFHPAPEWSTGIPHPVEASRGMEGSGDAWSPGWFEIPLNSGTANSVTVTLDADPPLPEPAGPELTPKTSGPPTAVAADPFTATLERAARQFVVRRGRGKTVIAGYPWFLDWGRDTLIACRGLLAAGMTEDVREILLTFARFEEQGTLPNAIYGENASNRDTTDAPLWFGIVCEEFANSQPTPNDPSSKANWYTSRVGDTANRTIAEVLRSIACGYLAGTSNGIRVDHASGLVWSPSHFTWMDTNHPAGTPREGYPVEIQALWLRLLRQLDELKAEPWDGRGESWGDLARRTEKSFNQYFWLEDQGWFADVLIASAGTPARMAPPSDALRSNALLPIALGLATGPRAWRTVQAAERWLVVPGALRSLAPLPVNPLLPIYTNSGGLLNDPANPYWPHYEGDEDTRRKPAYHNGTAWVWPFPHFCEALARAYPGDAAALAAARAYLGSVDRLLAEGCLGHLPEILDGNTPHTQRGCDAQAWSITEVLRVWHWLNAQ